MLALIDALAEGVFVEDVDLGGGRCRAGSTRGGRIRWRGIPTGRGGSPRTIGRVAPASWVDAGTLRRASQSCISRCDRHRGARNLHRLAARKESRPAGFTPRTVHLRGSPPARHRPPRRTQCDGGRARRGPDGKRLSTERQLVGQAAHHAGFEGLLAPSATGAGDVRGLPGPHTSRLDRSRRSRKRWIRSADPCRRSRCTPSAPRRAATMPTSGTSVSLRRQQPATGCRCSTLHSVVAGPAAVTRVDVGHGHPVGVVRSRPYRGDEPVQSVLGQF